MSGDRKTLTLAAGAAVDAIRLLRGLAGTGLFQTHSMAALLAA